MHRILIAGSALIVLLGTRPPARGAGRSPLVRWSGQPAEAAPTPAPRGALLHPTAGSNYWGPAVNSGAKIH